MGSSREDRHTTGNSIDSKMVVFDAIVSSVMGSPVGGLVHAETVVIRPTVLNFVCVRFTVLWVLPPKLRVTCLKNHDVLLSV